MLQVWLVGDGLEEKEQMKAPQNTKFIPFSQFPLKRVNKSCMYYSTPAFMIPKALQNVDSCEVQQCSHFVSVVLVFWVNLVKIANYTELAAEKGNEPMACSWNSACTRRMGIKRDW